MVRLMVLRKPIAFKRVLIDIFIPYLISAKLDVILSKLLLNCSIFP